MNTQNKEINGMIKKTKRYWYVDGFSEIGVGLLLILIILFNYAAGRVQEPILQIFLFTLGMPLLIYLGSKGINLTVRQLKEKITYPRTGYVSYPHKTGSQRLKRVLLSALIGAALGVVLSIFSVNVPDPFQYVFTALVIALAYIYIGYSVGLVRFYCIAAATLLLMGVLLTQKLSTNTFFLSFFIGQGLIWIISGLLALWNYLRTTQPASPESES